MIDPTSIIDSVKALLETSFPGDPVYDKRLPEQFRRPSCYVEFLSRKTKDGGLFLVEVEDLFQVTGFVPTDDYYDSKASAVYAKVKAMEEIFLGHSVHVGDRWLHISKTETVSGLDYAVVSVTLSYMDDTPRPEGPKRQMMEHLTVNKEKIV